MKRLIPGLAAMALVVLALGLSCGKDGSSNPGTGGSGGSAGGAGGRGGSGAGGSGVSGSGGGGTSGAGGSGVSGSGGSAGGTGGGAGGTTGGAGSGGATGGTTGGGGASGAGGSGGSAGSGAGDGGGGTGGMPAANTTVVIFMIDGLQADTARTAAANGGTNLKFVIDNGVVVTTARSTSPAARTTLADGSLPWGNATSGNIAVHTGTHVYEANAQGLDDIFTAAKRAGIKSVFSGGDANYSGFTTPDYHLAASISDAMIVQNAIMQLKTNKTRLLRLHLQRCRDDWTGPAGKTNPASAYARAIVAADGLLGQLIQALKDEGVWNNTYLVVTADHGMGTTSASGHPASTASSWEIFMAFYGPDLKKGATIPYAELPDVAVMAARWLGLQLRGHAASVNVSNAAAKPPTGTVLMNLYMGGPEDVPHPRYVDQYLKMNTFPMNGDMYSAYRMGMLGLIK